MGITRAHIDIEMRVSFTIYGQIPIANPCLYGFVNILRPMGHGSSNTSFYCSANAMTSCVFLLEFSKHRSVTVNCKTLDTLSNTTYMCLCLSPTLLNK